MTALPSTPACRACRDRLAQAESSSVADPGADRVQLADLQVVRSHLATCTTCAKSLGGRLGDLESRLALRSRSVPDGMLDGFYERIEAEARMAPLGGGMSLAFLDAPRSLRVWRSLALTTASLLVLGVVWVASRDASPPPVAGHPLRIDRSLTAPWSPQDQTPAERGTHSRPFHAPGRPAAPGFFRERPATVPASLESLTPRIAPAPGRSSLPATRSTPGASTLRRD